jgi:hypothetical protein
LLCLAVTGNAIVDFAKLVVDRNAGAVEVVVQFLANGVLVLVYLRSVLDNTSEHRTCLDLYDSNDHIRGDRLGDGLSRRNRHCIDRSGSTMSAWQLRFAKPRVWRW